MLLIHNDPAAMQRLSKDEQEKIMADVGGIMKELTANRELIGGAALTDVSQSRTVRVVDGAVATTDGPFAEVKEHLAGYITVDVPSLERAIEIASRWPDARTGAMEVRPILDTITVDE
ncbi:YciI family protein [Salinispora cortesiana]|uniref:YciI family protein n=1 Tax=Salinispora cortesiana TaxID=1305843 RepID=UPI00165FF056|nr:YciI family protein [Salinispora cortesiana]